MVDTKICRRCAVEKPIDQFRLTTYRSGKQAGYSFRASNCKPCDSQRVTEYHRANPDVYKATLARHVAKRLAEDPESIRREAAERQRLYRQRHPERIVEKRAKRNAENPGQSNDHHHRARAQQIGRVSYRQIIERDGDLCYLCGELVVIGLPKRHPLSRSFDHVIALTNGGEHSNENIRVAHYGCNLKKGRR